MTVEEKWEYLFSCPAGSTERTKRMNEFSSEEQREILNYDRNRSKGIESSFPPATEDEYQQFKRNITRNPMLCLELQEKEPKKYNRFMERYKTEPKKPTMDVSAFM